MNADFDNLDEPACSSHAIVAWCINPFLLRWWIGICTPCGYGNTVAAVNPPATGARPPLTAHRNEARSTGNVKHRCHVTTPSFHFDRGFIKWYNHDYNQAVSPLRCHNLEHSCLLAYPK